MTTLFHDQLHRFLFDNTAVRGNIVRLNHTFNTALQHHDYPPVLRIAIGELMAASALLAATLKIEGGALVLQIQGKGALKLLVVECLLAKNSEELTMRATATLASDIEMSDLQNSTFTELIGEGHFVITLDPKDGGQAYQGIVPIEGDNIAEILQNYMQRSEQIETRIWLTCDGESAAGMLLQKLPDMPEQDTDAWPRSCYLADTIRNAELLGLATEDLLLRVFNQEDVRLFAAQAVRFHCSCSVTSVGNMLRLLGVEEVKSILDERGNVEVNCDFCNKQYAFDKVDTELLFKAEIVVPGSSAKH